MGRSEAARAIGGYADACAASHLFGRRGADRSVSERSRRMVGEATTLPCQEIGDEWPLAIIANEQALVTAPGLTRHVAARFLDFAGEHEA